MVAHADLVFVFLQFLIEHWSYIFEPHFLKYFLQILLVQNAANSSELKSRILFTLLSLIAIDQYFCVQKF